MTRKCPLRTPFVAGCLAITVGLVAAYADPVLAGENPNFTFVLHAETDLTANCVSPFLPDCVVSQPSVVVQAGDSVRVFFFVNNVAEVAAVQTAFEWDPSWELLGSSWNCQANQLTISSPDPATNGGATEGSVVTAFSCTTASMVLIGYMDFAVGTSGCLEQVQSSYPYGDHVVD